MVASQILQIMALLNGYIWSWLLEVVWVLALLPAQSEKKINVTLHATSISAKTSTL